MEMQMPFGIQVQCKDGGGAITSALHEEGVLWMPEDEPEVKARALGAADALESFLLALACQGVDVRSAEFGNALTTTVEALAENL